MGLKINDEGDIELTSPDGEFLAAWSNQPLTMSLVHGIVNEAYRQGFAKAGKQIADIKRIINGH